MQDRHAKSKRLTVVQALHDLLHQRVRFRVTRRGHFLQGKEVVFHRCSVPERPFVGVLGLLQKSGQRLLGLPAHGPRSIRAPLIRHPVDGAERLARLEATAL